MLRVRHTRCPHCGGALTRREDCTSCYQHSRGPTAREIALRMLSVPPAPLRNVRPPTWMRTLLGPPGLPPTWEPGPECRVRGRVHVLCPASRDHVAANRWGGGRFLVTGEGPPALIDDDALELTDDTYDVCDGDRVEVVGPARLESRDDLAGLVADETRSGYRGGGSVLVFDAPPGSHVRMRRL